MYTQSQPTLPPINAAIGVGENYNSSSLGNGDMLQHHIKQEQQPPPSLPPIRTSNNNSNQSIMSINQLCNDTESDYEKMKEAAAVLENMKTTSLPSIANISSQPQPQPLEPRTHAESSQLPNSPSTETGFMTRLVNVGNAIVENGVNNVFKPVIEHVYGPLVNNDNEGKHGIENDDALGQSESENRKRRVSRSSSPSYRNPSRPHRASQSSGSSNSSTYAPYTYPNSTVSTTTYMRSRWQQVVIGAGATFGAAGAAVSEESMKSLKYCLQWINYATQHIDTQIAVLKEFIVNLTNSSNRAVVHTSSSSTLSSIKKEVVDTLRKVIEVVSKYAGACLPDQAKIKVRSFILNLPTRWASINHTEHSSSPSPVSSPQLAPANGHPLNQTADYARRLLSLATESLDMLRSVAGIFGETVGRAEELVQRLRAIGIPSGGANAMGNLHFDNIWPSQTEYSSSGTSSHSRSRRSSNSARNHGSRKQSRPTPPLALKDNDEEEDPILNDSDSSSESEAEPMRMEMDNAQKRALKSVNAKSQQQHTNGALNGIKKRKKIGKKENDMDIS